MQPKPYKTYQVEAPTELHAYVCSIICNTYLDTPDAELVINPNPNPYKHMLTYMARAMLVSARARIEEQSLSTYGPTDPDAPGLEEQCVTILSDLFQNKGAFIGASRSPAGRFLINNISFPEARNIFEAIIMYYKKRIAPRNR